MNPKSHLILLFAVLLSMLFDAVFAQKSWQDIHSTADLYQNYPELVKEVFVPLDLSHPGMEKVKEAYQKEEWVKAADELLAYYRKSANSPELRREIPKPTKATVATADTTLSYVFFVQNVRGEVPLLEDGHRDWYYKGPNNDREWAWLSNRHTQLAEVFNAYYETGNPKYAEFVDLFLKDFILKSMPYPAAKGSESIWRGLEVSFRAKAWSRIFYGMQESEYLSPATRLLMLRSLSDHAHYNRNFHGANNWLTMEISALATVAANFPEYKESSAWLDYSIDVMVESMKDQVYPDGAQTELASHYHNVSLHNFELFREICEKAGRELPEFFVRTIEDMYGYIASAVRPDGLRILNNDGDTGSDRELILKGAEKFGREDWRYIATNGKEGVVPNDAPSYLFPWAGQLVSRSGYDENAHWSFFDIGPWGSGHQHNDKLHLSIVAYGRDLLVDAGRFAYTGEIATKFRPYALGSSSHNLILIDGKGQANGPTHAKEPLDGKHYRIEDGFDYASHFFDQFKEVEGKAKHSRSLMYVRGEFWLVVDKVETDRPRKVETLWHWHPRSEVKKDGLSLKTSNEVGNLAIIPVGDRNFDVRFVKGQEEPEIQGWYSEEYNVYEPNLASIYETEIKADETFVWLLLPSEGETPAATAKVLAKTDREVEVEVSLKDKVWRLVVPFMDSERAVVKVDR